MLGINMYACGSVIIDYWWQLWHINGVGVYLLCANCNFYSAPLSSHKLLWPYFTMKLNVEIYIN